MKGRSIKVILFAALLASSVSSLAAPLDGLLLRGFGYSVTAHARELGSLEDPIVIPEDDDDVDGHDANDRAVERRVRER